MTTSPRLPRLSRSRALPRRAARLLLLVAALGPTAGVAVAAPPPLTDADRVAFWLDRLVRGPEPGRVTLPNFHQGLLTDAQQNLEAMADATLDRLADPAFRRRLQDSPDMNPWHGVLAVLARIGPRRPDVARAWAVPALTHEQKTMRRQAVTVLVGLASPDDAPALLGVIRRDADDRFLAPTAIAALVGWGAPWDGEAARATLDRGTDDGAGVGSTAWAALVAALASSTAPSRDAVLAWTALCAEASGPRPAPPRTRNVELVPDDPRDAVASAATRTSGRLVAAVARATLARGGAAPWRAAVARDLADPTDADLGAIAADGLVRDAAQARAVFASAEDLAARLRADPTGVTPDALVWVVTALRTDRRPGAGVRLRDLFSAIPADARFLEALLRSFDGARELGVEPAEAVAAHLASGDRARIDLALRLVRRAPDGPYLEVVEAWLATPASASVTSEGRRTLVYLYAVAQAKGRLPADRAAAFAATLRGWADETSDASATGLLGGLLDLGPAGERELVAGLKGPRRPAYVALLASATGHRLGAAAVDALLEPLAATTPSAARTELWTAVFRVASADALPAIEAALARLPASARAEGEAIARLVRHRAPR